MTDPVGSWRVSPCGAAKLAGINSALVNTRSSDDRNRDSAGRNVLSTCLTGAVPAALHQAREKRTAVPCGTTPPSPEESPRLRGLNNARKRWKLWPGMRMSRGVTPRASPKQSRLFVDDNGCRVESRADRMKLSQPTDWGQSRKSVGTK